MAELSSHVSLGKAGSTAAVDDSFIGIDPTGKTPEQIEREWYDTVYRGNKMPQLTFRAVGMGMFLGCVMAFSNIYIGLKTGWALGVTLTACILSFSIFRFMSKTFGIAEPSILENNCMQSTASAAGYSTGGTLISAFAAYLMLEGKHPPIYFTFMLVFFLATLGVFMAVPMKRNMINIEQLRFPTGTATAVTLRSLHAAGGEALSKARRLYAAMGFGAVLAWFRDAMGSLVPALSIPSHLPLAEWLRKAGMEKAARVVDPAGYTFAIENSSIMIAAGALMGFRVGWSLLLGSVLAYGVLAPIMHSTPAAAGSSDFIINVLGYRKIVAWTVWPGVSMMVCSALLSFAFQGKTVLRAFSSLGAVFSSKKTTEQDPMEKIEVPTSWFITGIGVGTVGCVGANYMAFQIGIGHGLLAVAISFLLAIVACRATGETDTTPIGALGKITQLTYGILIPSNMTANLMTANITACTASASADLLSDLKSGYVLGANPRQQFLAQFAGVFAGTLVAVPAFYLLVPNKEVLGSARFPAPAAQVWKAVAELLANGVHSLHPTALYAMVIGGLVGILITLAERYLPQYKAYIPSPTGLGLAFVIPAWNAISMFLGSLIALYLEKRKPVLAEGYVIPVASGLIAGESILGVVVALLSAVGVV